MLRRLELPIEPLNELVSFVLPNELLRGAAKLRINKSVLESCGCEIIEKGGGGEPSFVVNVPSNKLHLFDLGGVAATVACFLTKGEHKFSVKYNKSLNWIINIPSPNERMFITSLAYSNLNFSIREAKAGLDLATCKSFWEMIHYLNGGFSNDIGQKCEIKFFDLLSFDNDFVFNVSWRGNDIDGRKSLEIQLNNEQVEAIDKPKGNGLLIVYGSSRDVVVSVADALARSMSIYGANTYLPTIPEQVITDLEVIDLTVEIPDRQNRIIRLAPYQVEKWLGVRLHPFKCLSLLRSMGFDAKAGIETLFNVDVQIPAYRFDVRQEVDLIGEIACALGYREESELFSRRGKDNKYGIGRLTYGKEAEIEKYSHEIRQTLIGLRFQEIVCQNVVSDKEDNDVLVEDDVTMREKLVKLTREQIGKSTTTLLRRHLYTNLLDKVKHAVSRAELEKQAGSSEEVVDHFAFFELGDVFEEDIKAEKDAYVISRRYLCGVVAHDITKEVYLRRWETLFDEIKAVVEAVLKDRFNTTEIQFSPNTSPIFLINRAANISIIPGRIIGRMGEVEAELLHSSQIYWPVALFEIDLSQIYDDLISK